ncbi:caspase-8-like [Arctopsyche grandis]|uniref:caspase-8-like n=1 Tax=Arctopsyche grandis TaxID=121162 RepID=UPI00406D9354
MLPGFQSSLFGTARIELDILHDVESNLELYEKISLVFLLYNEVAVAQERLTLLLLTPDNTPSILHDWACSHGATWRQTLVEALLIIQAYSDLSALGLDIPKLKDHFLPHRLETSLFVHPVKKVLYAICEAHVKSDTHTLVKSLECSFANVEVDEYDYKYLELFILKLLRNKFIYLGPWRQSVENKTFLSETICDIEGFAKFLDRSKFEKLYENLISAQKYINQTVNSIKDDKQILNKIVNLPTSKPSDKPSCSSSNNLSNDFLEKYPILDSNDVGYFLIINQKIFESNGEIHFEERLGTDLDVQKLTLCWQAYGFTVKVLENLPHYRILPEISSHIKRTSSSHSAFAVCILSHGQNDVVFGSDSKPVEVNRIKEVLCSYHEALICKPKLLIIQACRGEEMMKSVFTKNSNIRTDSPLVILPEPADLLVFWATVANYVSYRDTLKGTWFIETLCNCMMNYGDKLHLSDVFTKVNSVLSEKKVQISQFESTWRKIFQLKKLS